MLNAISVYLMIRLPGSDAAEQVLNTALDLATTDHLRLFWIPVGAMNTAAVVWTSGWAWSELSAFRSRRASEDVKGDALVGDGSPDSTGALTLESAPPRSVWWTSKSAVGVLAATTSLLVAIPVAIAAYEPIEPSRDPLTALFGDARVHGAKVAALPESTHGVVIEFDPPRGTKVAGPDLILYAHTEGLLAQLRLSGIDVRFRPEDRPNDVVLRAYRRDHPATGDERVVILYRTGGGLAESDAPPGYRRISYYDANDPPPKYEGFDGHYFFPTASAVFVKEAD